MRNAAGPENAGRRVIAPSDLGPPSLRIFISVEPLCVFGSVGHAARVQRDAVTDSSRFGAIWPIISLSSSRASAMLISDRAACLIDLLNELARDSLDRNLLVRQTDRLDT